MTKINPKIVSVLLSFFLLTSAIFLVVASATVVFSANFDSKNFSAWTISNNSGGTESIQTAAFYGGSNVAKFTLASSAGSWAVITKDLGTTYSSLYLAGYVYLDNAPSSGNYLMAGMTLDSYYGYDLASAFIHNNGGNIVWNLEYTGSGGSTNYVDSSVQFLPNTMYYVEVMCKDGAGTGEVTMWVNNTQVSDVTGLTNNIDGASRVLQVGTYSASAISINDYIDTISASTAFISMPTQQPSPTPTPTPPGQQILCLGDSITVGYSDGATVTPYPTTLQSLTGIPTTNGGVGGEETSGMVTQWNTIYSTEGFTILVLLGGINDVFAGVAESTIEANLQTIWQSAESKGCTVYALTILPSDGESAVVDVNTWILATAPTLGVHVVDLYPLFNDPSAPTYLNPIYDSGDGTHLNQAGYNLIANTVYAAMNPTPTPTPTPNPTPTPKPTPTATPTPTRRPHRN